MELVPPYGSDNPDYIFIGYAVSNKDFRNGIVLSDESGKKLKEYLDWSGFSRHNLRFTALYRHYLDDDPSEQEKQVSRKILFQELHQFTPNAVFTLSNKCFEEVTGRKPNVNLRKKGFDLDVGGKVVKIYPLISPVAVLKGGTKYESEIKKTLIDVLNYYHPEDESRLDYQYLDTVERVESYLNDLVSLWKKGELERFVVIDLETSTLSPFDQDAFLLNAFITHCEGQSYCIPIDHYESPFLEKFDSSRVKEALRIFLTSGIPLSNQNMKFDYNWFRVHLNTGRLYNLVGDSMVASYCLYNKSINHKLDNLIPSVLAKPSHKGHLDYHLEQGKKNHGVYSYRYVPMDVLCEYGYKDSDYTYRITCILEDRLKEQGLYDFYRDFLLKANFRFLADMEYNGAWINNELMGEVKEFYEKLINESHNVLSDNKYVRKAYQSYYNREVVNKLSDDQYISYKRKMIPESEAPVSKRTRITKEEYKNLVNFNSPQFVKYLIYSVMCMPDDITEGSTDKQALNEFFIQLSKGGKLEDAVDADIKLEFFDHLLRYRKNNKLYTSYVKPIPTHMRSDGMIHPTFSITAQETGRVSSSEPALQTFPSGAKARDVFESRFENGVILHVDYSQMELRVVAMISGDQSMKDTFLSGEDIHTKTAADVMKLPVNEVPYHVRKHVKTIVFGILYGRGAGAIARDLGIEEEEAQQYIDKFFGSRQGLHKWVKDMQVKMDKGENLVTTPFGRRIMIYQKGDTDKHSHYRCAVNYPIQGTASDFTLLAGTNVSEELYRKGYKSKIFNFVHDSLLIDVYPGELEDIYRMCRYYMVDYPPKIYQFAKEVPLKADFEVGFRWGRGVEFGFEVDRDEKYLCLEGPSEPIEDVMGVLQSQGYSLINVEYIGVDEAEHQFRYVFDARKFSCNWDVDKAEI